MVAKTGQLECTIGGLGGALGVMTGKEARVLVTYPSVSSSLPAPWSKVLGVFAPQIFPTVHGVDSVAHRASLWHEYGLISVDTAAARQHRVAHCEASVGWNGRP